MGIAAERTVSERIRDAWILALLTVAGCGAREILHRRRDREWAAGARERVPAAEYLEYLEYQFIVMGERQ